MTERERLIERCSKLGPECKPMIEALLKRYAGDPAWGNKILDDFEGATDEDRVEMLAFIDGGGVKAIDDLRVEHRDGTPTSADLRRWAG